MSWFPRNRRARKTSSFSVFPKRKLENPTLKDFELVKVLGKGSFSKVFLVRTAIEKNVFAMKVLSKTETIKRQQVEHTFSEFRVLRDAEHPFICQLFYAFETEDKLFLVSEFCGGGELYFYLQTKKFAFSSKSVRFYVSEIILALEYLHNRHIVHRDLKPENVMFDELGHVRLIDFGLCKENVVGANDARTFCGTPEYMAPEMLYSKLEGRGHGKSVDFWGLGVLMYELLFGWPPFFNKSKKIMIENILEKELEFPRMRREVADEAVDMITKMLEKDSEKRLGICGNGMLDVKSHPFVVMINWTQVLRKKVKPPFRPKIKDVTENFDSKFTGADVKFSESGDKVDDLDNDIFDDFFYSRDVAIQEKKNKSPLQFMSRKKAVNNSAKNPQALLGSAPTMLSSATEGLQVQSEETIDVAHMQRFDEDESIEYPKAKVALEDFEVVKWLGKGKFSKVFLVRPNANPKELYAMKVLNKTELVEKHQIEHTNAEFSILRRIAHPFICALYHAFETESSIFLISEFCQGGELFYHVKRKGGFFDPEVRFFAAEIFLAVSFLHLKNVVYRDLKAENVMLDNAGHIRLIDFGCSKVKVYGFEDARTFCGTPAYFAPEMILGRESDKGHGKAVDWWSLGVLIYELYYGQTPFYDDNIQKMYDNILKEQVHFPKEVFVPTEAQDLVCEFLERTPKKRLGIVKPGIAKLIGHPFFGETDWELLSQKKIKPPFIPKLAGKTGHFDEKITSQEARLSYYEDKPEHSAEFLEFSFSR